MNKIRVIENLNSTKEGGGRKNNSTVVINFDKTNMSDQFSKNTESFLGQILFSNS
jgi:hypothetical protein